MSGIRATRQQHFQKYIDLNTELLKELRKEYHLSADRRTPLEN